MSNCQPSAPFVVILLGPPGSGKGTQSKRLAQDFFIPAISTGDLFRKHLAENTSIGQKAKGYMQSGLLVPDEIVLGMLYERIEAPDCINGFLLDGVPRTIAQAEQFTKHEKISTNLSVLCFEVPDEELIKRSAGRLVCRQCNTIYNRDTSPPTHDRICDKCGGEVYRRKDDEPEIVQERLKVYHAQTQPLIAYYDHLGLLTTFDANQPADVLHAEIKRYLDSK